MLPRACVTLRATAPMLRSRPILGGGCDQGKSPQTMLELGRVWATGAARAGSATTCTISVLATRDWHDRIRPSATDSSIRTAFVAVRGQIECRGQHGR